MIAKFKAGLLSLRDLVRHGVVDFSGGGNRLLLLPTSLSNRRHQNGSSLQPAVKVAPIFIC